MNRKQLIETIKSKQSFLCVGLDTDLEKIPAHLQSRPNGVVEFNKQEITFDGAEIAISNFMGIPIIEMSIDSQILKFFLDTGAKLSYLPNRLTCNYESIGTDEDFYPGVGIFQTESFEIPTNFGEYNFIAKYGNLPTLLQMTLMMGGADGIVGFDFFNNFKVVLDLKNNILKYGK